MARDEAALARRCEQDGTRDIFKPPQAPEWDPLDHIIFLPAERRSRGCRVLSGQDGISSAALPEIE